MAVPIAQKTGPMPSFWYKTHSAGLMHCKKVKFYGASLKGEHTFSYIERAGSHLRVGRRPGWQSI